ncbi:MAG: hypothetical protein O7H41_03460 [Planctomycetota bacterium]|nr:hypothetical protein [Planctomycetota bacterium]
MGRKNRGMGEKAPKDAAILLKLPQALKDALQRMADDDSRPLATYIRLTLLRHVESKKGGKR